LPEQTPYRRIVDGGFCDLAIEHGEVLAKAVELAQMSCDRGALVVGEDLTRSRARPGPLNSSACGHGGTRCAARIAWVSFFTRVRCRTI
jgi:hypothetical protein